MLLPVGCVSPSYVKEPQTEPLLGERTVFWPLLFSLRFILHIGVHSKVIFWANKDLDQLAVMQQDYW